MDDSLAHGYLASTTACILFALMYVPIKYYPTYDGITFQWFLCAGAWFFGFLLNFLGQFGGRNQAEMTQGMLGGSMWAIANYLVVPTMQLIGLGLGFSCFNVSNLVVGYAVGRFGLFGVDPDPTTWVGDLGLCILVLSFVFMLRVKTADDASPAADETPTPSQYGAMQAHSVSRSASGHQLRKSKSDDSWRPMNRKTPKTTPSNLSKRRSTLLFGAMPGAIAAIGQEDEASNYKTFTSSDLESLRRRSNGEQRGGNSSASPARNTTSKGEFQGGGGQESKDGTSNDDRERASSASQAQTPTPTMSITDSMPEAYQRIVGFFLALVSGAIMGTQLIPFLWWKKDNPTLHPWSYVNAHTSGVFTMSTMIYLIYSTYAKLKSAKVPHSGIRPAFMSGVVWCLAFTCNLTSLSILGYSTGYTLGSIGPVMITSGLSYFWFEEVRDPGSVRYFFIALALQVPSYKFHRLPLQLPLML